MAYQFLDKSGLNIILHKIKNIFVPKERKIAELDLRDDITAEELQDCLSVYPIVELSRKPKSAPEQELELKGKVGQLGMYKNFSIVDFYRCISVTKHPQYGNTFIYEWEYIGSNSNLTYLPYDTSNVTPYIKTRGDMVYCGGNSPALYVCVIEGQAVRIPIATDIVTTIDENSTDNQIPSAKLLYNTVGTIETALDSIIEIQESLIGGATQ